MNISVNGIEISLAVPTIIVIIKFIKWLIIRYDNRNKKKKSAPKNPPSAKR